MGLINSVVNSGATLSATGGTGITLSQMGLAVNNGVAVFDAAITDARLRRVVKFRSIPAKYDSRTKTWSKQRCWVTHSLPMLLADGSIAFNVWENKFEFHPELSQANADDIRLVNAQLQFDTDFVSFWRTGSLG